MTLVEAPQPKLRGCEGPDGAPKEMPPDVPPAQTLGDIMPTQPTPFKIPEEFMPLERLVLTANGNLQRIVSSFYNLPVTVTVVYNRRVEHARYEREVRLSVAGVEFGMAESTVTLEHEEHIEAIEVKGIGIGQLFRHFNVLPSFALLDATREADGAFQRTYSLKGRGITCVIVEKFPPKLFGLDLADRKVPGASGQAHFGDIISMNETGMKLPEGFSPLQRVLLTANGNVQRLVSSYYNAPVELFTVYSNESSDGTHERKIIMSIFGKQFMTARTTIHFLMHEWIEAMRSGVPITGLFQHMGVLPTFALHKVEKGIDHFWRVYSLRTDGMVCEVHETFSNDIFDEMKLSPEETPEHVHY